MIYNAGLKRYIAKKERPKEREGGRGGANVYFVHTGFCFKSKMHVFNTADCRVWLFV